MKKLLLCFILIAGGVAFAADDLTDEISPWEYWRHGFEAYERGEQFYNAHKREKALTEYLKAKQAFLKVKQAKPNWRQDIIMQRVKLCDEKISLLKYDNPHSREPTQTVDDRYSYPTSTQPTHKTHNTRYNDDDQFTFASEPTKNTVVPRPESREIKLLKSQLKDYRAKLFSALVKLEEYRNKDKRNSNALSEIEDLIKEKSEINRKYQLMLQKYTTLQHQQQIPQAEKNALNNKLIAEKMHSDLLEQKVKMYQNNIAQLENELETLKQNQRKDQFSVRKSDAKITALEDEIKRLNHNIVVQSEQAKKLSIELEKQQYINGIEQHNIKGYKARLQTLTEWLNNSGKDSAATINQKIARENIAITKQLSEAQSKNDDLLRENLKLKNDLSEAHVNITQIKSLLSAAETAKLALKQRLSLSSQQARKASGNSTLQTAEMKKLRMENRQLKQDLNLFGKSYSKRSETAEPSTVSQYKLIIDKLNAQLATEKSSSQQYKLTHAATQQKLIKLKDEYSKLKANNLDLTEENKNLKAFVKDYDALTKAHDKLKEQFSQNLKKVKELTALKQRYTALVKDNKTLTDKLTASKRAKTNQIVLPVKTENKITQLNKALAALRQTNSSLTSKMAEYVTKIKQLEKQQTALTAQVDKLKHAQVKTAKLKKTELGNRANLAQTIKQLQGKISSTSKKLALTQKNQLALKKQLTAKISELNQLKTTLANNRNTQANRKKQLTEQRTEITQLKNMLQNSKQEIAKYQAQLKERIQQAVKIQKTTPQQLPEKLSDQQIAFLLQEGIQSENSNDYEAAAWHYKKILSNIPDHPEANRRLGLINLSRGNYNAAARELEKALRAAPKDAELLLAFAAALVHNGKNKAALVTVKQALTITPDNSRAYIIKGTILQHLKQNKAAEDSFRHSLSLSPDSAEANLKLAQILVKDNTQQKAAGNYYRKALKLGATNDMMLDKIFAIKATAKASEAVSTLRQMASQHEAQKNYVAAAWCYSQLLALDKHNPAIKLKYATVLLLDNKPKQALPLLKATVTTAKDKLTGLLLLGANYLMLNNTAEATKIYRQALLLLKAAPKYRLPAAVKQLNTTLKNKLGNSAGKEFAIINKR